MSNITSLFYLYNVYVGKYFDGAWFNSSRKGAKLLSKAPLYAAGSPNVIKVTPKLSRKRGVGHV